MVVTQGHEQSWLRPDNNIKATGEFWLSLEVMMMPKLSKKQLQKKDLFDPRCPSRMWSKAAEDRRGICHQQNP